MKGSGVLAVIPSRLKSTRLPEKPLRQIRGKTLIHRVWDQALKCRSLSDVVIATDSREIEAEVNGFGGKVVMTDCALSCGSERVLQGARLLAKGDLKSGKSVADQLEDRWEIVLNVQGDMPFLRPEVIDRLVGFLKGNLDRFRMATIATPITSEEAFLSRSVVKAVVTSESEALYFSRAPIPFPREEEDKKSVVFPETGEKVYGYKHIGLYAFTPDGLRAYSNSDQGPLEKIERLEQLRVLDRGKRVGVLLVGSSLTEPGVEVDTPADLARAEEIAAQLD